MKILITGICGFAGSTIASELLLHYGADTQQISGIDNLSRPGSELNRTALRKSGVNVFHGDIRLPSDLQTIGDVDFVIDAAANASVLAGVDGRTSSRQLIEHNLQGTLNLLEFCKERNAGLILLSTSRVYSLELLAGLRVEAKGEAFVPLVEPGLVPGLSARGIGEDFPTRAPVSLYGATKLASEQLALEYGAAFGFPVWIDRCGVLAGAGQFARGDQGVISYWIHSWRKGLPLQYIGFDGCGYQVRDCMHPRDLVPLLHAQMLNVDRKADRIFNLGGGIANSCSLAQLSAWCAERFGAREVATQSAQRPFDAPWIVMDSTLAAQIWNWRVQTPLTSVLEEIARHAEEHPHWLDLTL